MEKIRLGSEGLGGFYARFCISEVCQFSPFLGIELNAIGYWSVWFFTPPAAGIEPDSPPGCRLAARVARRRL